MALVTLKSEPFVLVAKVTKHPADGDGLTEEDTDGETEAD